VLLKNVVIGYSLESALFAYHNQFHYINTTSFQPLFFEQSEGFSIFGLTSKKEMCDALKQLLGFLGLNLEFPNIQQVRIQDSIIKIFDTKLVEKYEFENCYVFENLKVSHENGIKKAAEEVYVVVDDFKISRIGKDVLSIDPVRTDDTLLSEVYFYNSLRIPGAKYITDAVTVSRLTKDDLYSFDSSDTMASFKLRHILNNLGYHGIPDGQIYKSGKPKIKKIKVEHVNRYVTPVDRNTYFNNDIVRFMYLKAEEYPYGFSAESK